jgi:hypothetical protein
MKHPCWQHKAAVCGKSTKKLFLAKPYPFGRRSLGNKCACKEVRGWFYRAVFALILRAGLA